MLQRVPDAWLFEPWRMPTTVQPHCGVRVGQDWPLPLVDLDEALRQAKARLHERRRDPAVRQAAADVVQRHGSRRGMPGARDARGREPATTRRRPPPPQQASLF